ncbi:MAG: hypothetical protein HOV81_39970 [Kofleriaceae bacterium]|nr:hypothetical protein [Kofleriaceae bacterium]
MKRVVIAAMMVLSVTALAGKEERDFMTKEVKPAAQAAAAKYKSACGCALAINIDETTFKSKDDMPAARNLCNFIAEGVGDYCNDAASKKAMCQMKSLTIKKGDDATFTFKAGKGVATVYGITAPSFEMLTGELDK